MKYLLFAFSVLEFSTLYTQSLQNYSVSRTTGITYTSIATTGNSIGAWRNNGTFGQDDNRSYPIPLGFDFWYNGVRFDEISVSTNGFIDFSTSNDDGGPVGDDFGYINSAFTALAAANRTYPALAPFYDDLTAQGGTQALTNSIKYETSGTAPNRVFTVEWVDMAVYLNTSPSLNFQVKLYEHSGIIEFIYGNMTQGSHTFSYTCGLNGHQILNNTTNLLIQQTANTTTFNNGIQNNLSTLPSSNSKIQFAPPVPANASGTLTISSITNTSITLNFPNWASNEVGYVIYYSIDGSNYEFTHQTAANATSATINGLMSSTTYYFRVYAVTEGALSNTYLSGSATTSVGIDKVSVMNGNWNNPNIWNPVGVPNSTHNVTISNGNTVVVNTNAICNDLTVNGSLIIGNNNTARVIDVLGNINVNNSGQITINTNSNNPHQLYLYNGNITNNGTINLNVNANRRCNVFFESLFFHQQITGNATVNNYNTVELNKQKNKKVTVNSSIFTVPANFLILNNGIFEISNNSTNTYNVNFTSINKNSGIIFNCPNAVFNFTQSLTLQGLLKLEDGTINIGNAANENFIFQGGTCEVNSGNMNIAGILANLNINSLLKYKQSDGIVRVNTIGSNSTSLNPLHINSTYSDFKMSGGSFIIVREGGTGVQDLGLLIINNTHSQLTGGTIQLGDNTTPANQTMRINAAIPFYNLHLNGNSTTTAQLITNPITINNNLDIVTGTLNANNLNITISGNWNNNGGTYIPGTNTTIFNGYATQNISHSTTEIFNHLTINGSSNTVLQASIQANGNFTLNGTLDVSSSSFDVILNGHASFNGTFIPQEGKVILNGINAQNINSSASSEIEFYDLESIGSGNVNFVSGNYKINNSITVNNTLNADTNLITLVSNNDYTAYIKPSSGNITGSLIIQRFISNRPAGFSDMASPILNSTFSDWDNELLLIYNYSPPSQYPSVWTYEESPLYDYIAITSSSDTHQLGKGYEVYLDEDGNYSTMNDTILDTRGTPFIGSLDISASLTYNNDGWNLIGNPYASHINWNALHTNTTNVSANIMMYDESINDFEVISSGDIAPHQGFWVEVTGPPVFTFTESVKSNNNSSQFKNGKSNELFTIRLYSDDIPFTSNSKIILTKNTQIRDVTFKGLPHPIAPDLYSLKENKKIRINCTDAKDNFSLALGINIKKAGYYKLKSINIEKLTSEYNYNCILLHDKYSGEQINLIEQQEYQFYSLTGEFNNRFTLEFKKDGDCKNDNNLADALNISAIQNNNSILVSIIETLNNPVELRLLNSTGSLCYSTNVVNTTGNKQITIPVKNLSSGMYYLFASSKNNQKCIKLFINSDY